MRKIQILFVVLAIVSIAFSSCKKDEYCASCVEANSGYKPEDYCGSSSEVDDFIDELYRQGSAAGQNWTCQKNID
ncbi:hypothetical protein ACFL6I_05165 [candidate division KSB1 bacterium]